MQKISRLSLAPRFSGLLGLSGMVGLLTLLVPHPLAADTVRQRMGLWSDTQGTERVRGVVDGQHDFDAERFGLSSTAFSWTLSRDELHLGDEAWNNYEEEIYGSPERTLSSANATFSQTWDKITDSRVGLGWSSDGKVVSRSGSVGVSRWFAGENFQVALDFSRTLTERPRFPVLDYDFAVVDPPTRRDFGGVSLSLRQLASPTMIVLAGASWWESNDRPPLRVYTAGFRKFLPPLRAAIHASGARAVNSGTLTTESMDGELSSWQSELSWLQQISQQLRGKLSWRAYREDETTRAYGDELTFGSDLFVLGFARDLPRGFVAGVNMPVTVELNGTRWISNKDIAASAVEAGASVRF
jgi:hypothetical protein